MESLFEPQGFAIFVTGLLAVLMWAIVSVGNVAAGFAGIMWGISIVVLIFVGVFSVGLELFWLSIVATVFMIIVGMVVRIA